MSDIYFFLLNMETRLKLVIKYSRICNWYY